MSVSILRRPSVGIKCGSTYAKSLRPLWKMSVSSSHIYSTLPEKVQQKVTLNCTAKGISLFILYSTPLISFLPPHYSPLRDEWQDGEGADVHVSSMD